MKAILEFNLPEDYIEHEQAVKAGYAFGVLQDFDQWLRDEIKYHGKRYKVIREKLNAMLTESNINIYQ